MHHEEEHLSAASSLHLLALREPALCRVLLGPSLPRGDATAGPCSPHSASSAPSPLSGFIVSTTQ